MPTVIAQAPGPAGVAQTLRTMRVLIQASAIDPLIRRQAAQATAHCARADARCQCASMLSWVKRKMRFVPDPAGVEALHDPRMIARAIEDGRDVYGDCDDFSVYLASLLAAIGRKPILRAVGYNGRPYQHVYVVCDGMRLDATKDDWQQPVGLGMLRETSSMLLECESGRLTLSGFFDDLGNMFKRMVKFTPKSFRPANIFRAATSTALTAVTGGAYQFLPSNVKRQVEEVGKIAVPAIAAIAGLNMLAPSVIPTLTSKLGTVANNLGKPLGQIGSALINQMMNLPAPQQAAIAEAVTPADLQQIEQTGQVPEHLQRLLMQSAHQAYYPPPPPGPAGQIPAFAEQPELPRAEAGMIGGANLALWIGLSAVAVLVLQGRPRR